MPTIPLTDSLGLKLDLDFDDRSDAAQLGLTGLEAKTSEFINAASLPLDKTTFRAALFGGTYKTPTIALSEAGGLTVQAGANTTIRVLRSADELEELGVPAASGEAWVGFGLDVSLVVNAGAALPSGFGISGRHATAHAVSVYTRIAGTDGRFPSLHDAVEQAISNFRVAKSAADLRMQSPNTVYEWEVSGSFAIEASYTYPLAVNALTLATAKLPLNQQIAIAPAVTMNLTGSLAVSGEFRGRCYRANESTLRIGLFKKKETDLAASFTASAGVTATIGSTDLLASLVRALPGANFDVAQIPEGDRKALSDSLASAINQGFSVALNASCSAALVNEAAVLYEVNLAQDDGQTEAALAAALGGNWSALAGLKNAKRLKNVLTTTSEKTFSASLNLLGLYDYAQMSDFVRQCRILHSDGDGTITITDRETAQRIAVASEPLAADDEKLRKVMEESFLATAAYSAATSGRRNGPAIGTSQSLLLYKARESYSNLKKELLLGEALGLLSAGELASLALKKDFKYVRLAASADFQGDDALRLFFSDVAGRTPRDEKELKQLGRQILISLLDPTIPADAARRQILASDTSWAQMEAQRFPTNSPASYSDWYDITFWAHAIAAVGPKLKTVIETWQRAGADPSGDAAFMSARDGLAGALAEVTRRTHAAFERGWPIAVMVALAGRGTPVTFEAQWDGAKQFDKRAARALRA